MNGARRSGYESLTVGFMVIAFALSLLISWLMQEWWLFIPIMLILAGLFWVVISLTMRPGGRFERPGKRETPFFAFWGATLVLLGTIWIGNDAYPGNGVVLVVLFLIWIGAVAMALSLRRLTRVPKGDT
jgi:apolipoprotein N-acyltransferase